MQLKNDQPSLERLYAEIDSYYESRGRFVRIFSNYAYEDKTGFSVEFIIDRTHVVRYSIGEDRGFFLSALELGIGPRLFSPCVFWSPDESERFCMDSTPEAIEANLKLLDEFLGLRPAQTSR